LDAADWLDGAFSAGDLMMVSVLLRLTPSGVLDEFPKLAADAARGQARPAYKGTSRPNGRSMPVIRKLAEIWPG
jgi:glutathione S-transferase